MRRCINIFFFMLLAITGFAQETRVVDSLQDVLATQEGREKVKTMMELTWEFYDISFDDCIAWGEKAKAEAKLLNQADLEAEANYTLGTQYAYHTDFDVAKQYYQLAYSQYKAIDDSEYIQENGWEYSSVWYAFESLWNLAICEQTVGNIDTASLVYSKALQLAKLMDNSLSCAYVYANMAIISYQKGDFISALDYYYHSRKISKDLGMRQMEIQASTNIATIYSEIGKPQKAKIMFQELLPELEAEKDYYVLQNTCKNLGSLYAHEIINYDSAMYYFEKSMYYSDFQVKKKIDQNLMRMLKSDVLSEMAFVNHNRGDNEEALKGYVKALALAEEELYIPGQMTACIGLGTVYAQMGRAKESIRYFDRFSELETMVDATTIRASIQLPLILDYARLGRYDDLETTLRNMDDERAALVRENADLYDRNRELEETVVNLVVRDEQQNEALAAQQIRLRHYRLAFFGILGLVMAALFGWLAAKIVKHYFASHAKSSK